VRAALVFLINRIALVLIGTAAVFRAGRRRSAFFTRRWHVVRAQLIHKSFAAREELALPGAVALVLDAVFLRPAIPVFARGIGERGEGGDTQDHHQREKAAHAKGSRAGVIAPQTLEPIR